MSKVKLLNDGGYTFLEGVKFPVVVDACEDDWLGGFNVEISELESIGADSYVRGKPPHETSWYFTEEECEVILK